MLGASPISPARWNLTTLAIVGALIVIMTGIH
jgi:hypothetical protein